MVWRYRSPGFAVPEDAFPVPKAGENAILVTDVLKAYTLGSLSEAQLWIEQRRVNVSQNRWIRTEDSSRLRVDTLPLEYRTMLVHKPASISCNWATGSSLRFLAGIRPIGLSLFPYGFHQPSGMTILTNQPEVVDAIVHGTVELVIDPASTAPLKMDIMERFEGKLHERGDGHVVVTFPKPMLAERWIRRYKGAETLLCITQGPFSLPEDLYVGGMRLIS